MIVVLVANVLLLLSKRLQLKRAQGNNIIVIILVTINLSSDDATDHIPVEDNPVYITMKTIHLKQNSAYEAVDLKTHTY